MRGRALECNPATLLDRRLLYRTICPLRRASSAVFSSLASPSRYQTLAKVKGKLKGIAKRLREQGKDATPTAVSRIAAEFVS
jgi:hypothetical protein